MAPLPGIHDGMLEHDANPTAARTAMTATIRFMMSPLGFDAWVSTAANLVQQFGG